MKIFNGSTLMAILLEIVHIHSGISETLYQAIQGQFSIPFYLQHNSQWPIFRFLQYSLYSCHDFMAFIFRKKGAPSTDARWIFASTICQEPGRSLQNFCFFCTKYMWEKWSWISAIVKEGSWNSWKVCAWLHWKSFGLAARPTLWSQSVAG